MEDGHRAINDANATLSILQSASFWASRKDVCKVISNTADIAANNAPTLRPPIKDDSDTEEAESDFYVEDDTPEDDEEEDNEDGIMVNRWRTDTPFIAPNVKARYNDVFTRETRGNSERRLPGLKISRNSVNSPLKAWNYIFTEPLLSKIVGYTVKSLRWDWSVGRTKT